MEIPTRFKDLISGGFSRESAGSDTHIFIGGISLLISKL